MVQASMPLVLGIAAFFKLGRFHLGLLVGTLVLAAFAYQVAYHRAKYGTAKRSRSGSGQNYQRYLVEKQRYPVPAWANILSWIVPLVICGVAIVVRSAPATKLSFFGLLFTYFLGMIWVRMAALIALGKPIPSFQPKAVTGAAAPNSWLHSRAGTFLQSTLLLGAALGATICG
jgi:hypothetical protein